jgi:hypothetical protein
MNAYRRWFLGLLVITTLTVVTVLQSGALPINWFTMDSTQIQALYQTDENPTSAGTFLNYPVQPLTGPEASAKFDGRVRMNETGWGQIQIGANFWGSDYDGTYTPGSPQTNVALGMDDLTGYDGYGLRFKNVNENAWKYNVYFNAGWTDSGFDEVDYYVQDTWTTIDVNESKGVVIDFTNAEVWKNDWTGGTYQSTTYLGWTDLTSIANFPWAHITNIGFNTGGDMPLLGQDYDFETKVAPYPIPEPSTLIILGFGVAGMAVYGWRRKKKQS